ncbi:MAG: glycosyltransferase [Cyanobacteria bacterium CRU_2_1]|nr:glycosyltransferase [Cyanobacteria bacterium CRU_2_1]
MSSVIKTHQRTGEELIQSLKGKRLIVYAGTLESYQGIDILIRAFKFVIEAEPDTFLLIVGGTPEQVQCYADLAEECGIQDDCLFTGRVAQPLAKLYVDQASVQISSRVSGTNTPLKVYEQLARGVPIVATNIYSHTQVLSEEVAFLVEPEPGDMANGILRALQSETESQRRAANAQKLYEEKYSRNVYKEKMKKLLELVS